jgi:hypothetical protein
MRRSRQTVLFARRAPTIKRWSLDARSEEQSACSFWESRGIRRSSPGLMARLCVPMGGRVRKLRAVEDQSAPIPKRERASLEGANGSSGVAGWKPSGIPSVTVVPTVILRSVPAFLLRTPGGGGPGCLRVSLPDLPERSAWTSPGGNLLEFPRPRSGDRGTLVSSSFPSRLSLSGYLAPPVMCAKPKGIPAERRDFSLGKGYSALVFLAFHLRLRHDQRS